MTAELLNQYSESCKDAVKSSSTKLGKTFENLFLLTWILNWSAAHQRLVWHLDIKMWAFLSHRTHLLIAVALLDGIVLFPFSLCKGIIDGEGEKGKQPAIHVGFPINLIG